DGSDPQANWETIEGELAAHDERLARLPRVLALSKADLVPDADARAARAAWSARLGEDVPVLVTSSATGEGLAPLADAVVERVPEAPPVVDEPESLAEHMTFRPAADRGFSVARLEDGSFRVSGRGMDRLIGRYDLDNDE